MTGILFGSSKKNAGIPGAQTLAVPKHRRSGSSVEKSSDPFGGAYIIGNHQLGSSAVLYDQFEALFIGHGANDV